MIATHDQNCLNLGRPYLCVCPVLRLVEKPGGLLTQPLMDRLAYAAALRHPADRPCGNLYVCFDNSDQVSIVCTELDTIS